MAPLSAGRTRHTVAFRLKETVDEAGFLDAARRLAAIPGVEEFELLRETSAKNEYRFGISMEFPDQAAYAAYNEHPDHVRFLRERWLLEVDDFLEIDYVRLPR
ncbi:MAG: Dabb family protein [Gaiellaceae bacterium]